mmetsp:Transcript_65570/g.207396  ORF Transcript_65570/g.207396 Transcript_65570/m.207396 type:complete len:249 (+) Transcript_65570:480-1226(+)
MSCRCAMCGVPWKRRCSSRTMRGSSSTATTFLQHSRSFWVRFPVPGPISSTTSVLLTPAFSTIELTTIGFFRMCWPKDFLNSMPPPCIAFLAFFTPPPAARRPDMAVAVVWLRGRGGSSRRLVSEFCCGDASPPHANEAISDPRQILLQKRLAGGWERFASSVDHPPWAPSPWPSRAPAAPPSAWPFHLTAGCARRCSPPAPSPRSPRPAAATGRSAWSCVPTSTPCRATPSTLTRSSSWWAALLVSA